MLGQIWLAGLGAVAGLMVLTWAASVARRDASLVDRVWGLGFVVAAWVYAALGDGPDTRGWLMLAAVTIWGLRLSVFITWRNWGHGEDKRYRAMRDKRPGTFAARSLVTVFLLQAVLAAVISLPLLVGIARTGPAELGLLDAIAVALWLVGFVFEAGGDQQLTRFLVDPTNRGKVMDRGLWRFTRHPNYFGDAAVWWAYGLFAIAAGGWWAAAGSILMTVLIVKVSGVALTDQTMRESKREGYDEYVRRTNAFFPGPRRAA
jgi:steroid 5-alpha reductase family enzyme